MFIIRTGLWLFVPAILLLSSCSGGSSDGAPPNNFSVSLINIDTAEPRIAYPLKVSILLKADHAADNVSVSLFAIENTGNEDVEVRQFPLGTEIIQRVERVSTPTS